MIEEETVLFQCEHQNMLEDETVLRNFWGLIDKEYEFKKTCSSELFLKVGSRFGPIDFSFDLYPSMEDNSRVCRIDNIQFVTSVLNTIKNYRVILEDGSGGNWGVYRKWNNKEILIDRLSEEKEHIFALNGEPLVKIITKPKKDNRWHHIPTIFESYDKTAFFKHEPDLDIEPNQVRLTLSFATEGKGKLFMDMYNKTLEHYIKHGSKVQKPGVLIQKGNL